MSFFRARILKSALPRLEGLLRRLDNSLQVAFDLRFLKLIFHISKENINRRQLEEDDVCPICQEELLEVRLPVTWCRACSNAAHIRCMKVWAEHQETMNRGDNGAPVLCPYCRQVNLKIP